MELAGYGVPVSEVERDPRPSRVTALLEAGRVISARRHLDALENEVNTNGVQGEVKETYPPGKKPPSSGVKTELVGYRRNLEKWQRRAYPEQFTAEQLELAREAEQERQRKALFSLGGSDARPMRLQVVRDEEGKVIRFDTVQDEPEGTGAGVQESPENR